MHHRQRLELAAARGFVTSLHEQDPCRIRERPRPKAANNLRDGKGWWAYHDDDVGHAHVPQQIVQVRTRENIRRALGQPDLVADWSDLRAGQACGVASLDEDRGGLVVRAQLAAVVRERRLRGGQPRPERQKRPEREPERACATAGSGRRQGGGKALGRRTMVVWTISIVLTFRAAWSRACTFDSMAGKAAA